MKWFGNAFVALLSIPLFLTGCGSDGVGWNGFQSNGDAINPSPNPGASVAKSCVVVYDLRATFSKDPATQFIDGSFYWQADSVSLTLTDSNCPFFVDSGDDPFALAVGQAISKNPGNDLFGLFFNQALVFGDSVVVDINHLNFTLAIPDTSFDSVPTCSYVTQTENGTLAPSSSGQLYELTATFPVTVQHPSNVKFCAAALANL